MHTKYIYIFIYTYPTHLNFPHQCSYPYEYTKIYERTHTHTNPSVGNAQWQAAEKGEAICE